MRLPSNILRVAAPLLALAVAACGNNPPKPPSEPQDTRWSISTSSFGPSAVAKHEREREPDLKLGCKNWGDRMTFTVEQVLGRGASTIGATDYGVLQIAGNDKRVMINRVEIIPSYVYDDYSYAGIEQPGLEKAILGAAPKDDIEFRRAGWPGSATDYPIANLAEVWPKLIEQCKAAS